MSAETPRSEAAIAKAFARSPLQVSARVLIVGNVSRQLEKERGELLAALHALMMDYELLSGDGMTESNQPESMRQARAAIAKATTP